PPRNSEETSRRWRRCRNDCSATSAPRTEHKTGCLVVTNSSSVSSTSAAIWSLHGLRLALPVTALTFNTRQVRHGMEILSEWVLTFASGCRRMHQYESFLRFRRAQMWL